MEMNVQNEIGLYAELFEQVRTRVNGETSIAGIILQEIGKNQRVRQMRAERQGDRQVDKNQVDAPATPRQLEVLRDLKADVPRYLSKRDASALLDSLLAQRAAQ